MEMKTADFERLLGEAMAEHKPLPTFPEGLTLDAAYEMLPRVIAGMRGGEVAGLKAGLTNPDLQAMLGLEQPVLGRLLSGGQIEPGATLQYQDKVVLECEIGIVIDALGNPLTLGPAIELVCLDFSRPEDMTVPNLVACSLGARGFIRGPQRSWDEAIGDHTITLTRDGELILEASILDSLGGPIPAYEWMAKEARKRGMPLGENMLVMTGTCGGAIPAEPGRYVADYGDLGSVEFCIA